METTAARACIVGRIRIKDPAKWVVYRDAVPATLVPFGGTVVMRGHHGFGLTDDRAETDVVMIGFPSVDAVRAWYDSPAYQALGMLRDEAADVVIVGYSL